MSTLVVIPTLDEAENIGRVLDDVLTGTRPGELRVVVVDGGSRDGTREIVAARPEPEISLLDNPRRLQSAAVNLAAGNARPDEDVMVRLDAHCTYPHGFVQQVTASLLARVPEGAASVVVPMATEGTSPVQRAIAVAQNSLLGNGGSPHRRGGESRWIEHGHHAAMLREPFLAVGGYDETMVANEDAELDARLIAAGHKIWFDGDAEIVYHPRASMGALARQYYRYGYGRAITMTRHHTPPKARQLAPLVVLLANTTGLVVGRRFKPALAIPATYALACTAIAVKEAVRLEDPAALLAAPAAAVEHHAWGVGFLGGLAQQHD